MGVEYQFRGIAFQWDANKAQTNIQKRSHMKTPEAKQKEKFALTFRPCETETVSIEIPKDALNSLEKIAGDRNMSVQALLKFYNWARGSTND